MRGNGVCFHKFAFVFILGVVFYYRSRSVGAGKQYCSCYCLPCFIHGTELRAGEQIDFLGLHKFPVSDILLVGCYGDGSFTNKTSRRKKERFIFLGLFAARSCNYSLYSDGFPVVNRIFRVYTENRLCDNIFVCCITP